VGIGTWERRWRESERGEQRLLLRLVPSGAERKESGRANKNSPTGKGGKDGLDREGAVASAGKSLAWMFFLSGKSVSLSSLVEKTVRKPSTIFYFYVWALFRLEIKKLLMSHQICRKDVGKGFYKLIKKQIT
jgi:hypothetical protein